jgi:16S rRNA (cytosine1402-N4)-methyltransferase
MTKALFHLPVLHQEVIDQLCPSNVQTFFDGTLGLGGHAELIMKTFPNLDKYIATELDPEHLDYAMNRLKIFKNKLEVHNNNFAELERILSGAQKTETDNHTQIQRPMAILLDLGLCSNQVDQAEKGFSFQAEGPLKMSFSGTNAAELFLNEATTDHLSRVFRDYGELPQHKRIAQRIAFARKTTPLKTTTQLRDIIEKATHPREHKKNVLLAFQAIRMEVNDELTVIKTAINGAFAVMKTGDRLGVMSYHSLEDRLVKQLFTKASKPVTAADSFSLHSIVKEADFFLHTRKPILPSPEEITINPRARSAKFRIIEHK